MTTVFKWLETNLEAFKQAELTTKSIISLMIQQEEGEVAKATITCTPIVIKPYNYGIITYKGKIIFKGKYISHKENDGLLTIELLAKSENYTEQCKSLAKNIKEKWPDIPFKKGAQLTDLAQSIQMITNVDRIDNKLSLTSINGKISRPLLSSDIIGPPTLIKLQKKKSTLLKTSIEWTQIYNSSADLHHMIAQKFESGIISTLTPESIKGNWPQLSNGIAKNIGQSGIQITHSEIFEISPPETGSLNLYPKQTPILENENGDTHTFKRTWLKGKLIVNWQYRQKRREFLNISNSNNEDYCDIKVNLHEIIDLPPENNNSHFFDLDKNKSVLNFLKGIFKSKCLMQSRSTEINITLPFDKFHTISTTSHLELKNITGFKNIKGKVVNYTLIQDQTNHSVHVKIACVEENSITKDEEFNIKTEPTSGFTQKDFDNRDIIESIEVINSAQHQQELMQSKKNASPQTLAKLPTKISIIFQNLTTKACLERSIEININKKSS